MRGGGGASFLSNIINIAFYKCHFDLKRERERGREREVFLFNTFKAHTFYALKTLQLTICN